MNKNSIIAEVNHALAEMYGLSVEDIGSRAEYQRKGTVWETVSHNCKFFNDQKSIHVTILNSNNNVIYLKYVKLIKTNIIYK